MSSAVGRALLPGINLRAILEDWGHLRRTRRYIPTVGRSPSCVSTARLSHDVHVSTTRPSSKRCMPMITRSMRLCVAGNGPSVPLCVPVPLNATRRSPPRRPAIRVPRGSPGRSPDSKEATGTSHPCRGSPGAPAAWPGNGGRSLAQGQR